MGNYLTRDLFLEAGVKTIDVDAFGGTVMVSELPAGLVQQWMEEGLMGGEAGEEGIDLSKLDFVEVARQVMVNPEDPSRPMLGRPDAAKLKRLSFGDVQRVVMASIGISDMGGAAQSEEEEEKN